jgi:tripartite-type tricarboxylate transporter receptor subunit TctC
MRDGLVRVLAYTAEGRPPDSPEAPTVRQTGLDYEAESWWAIFGPRGMPREIRQTLNDAINQILRDPEIIRTFNTLGSNPSPMSLDDFTKLVNEESARWAEVARVARIRVD